MCETGAPNRRFARGPQNLLALPHLNEAEPSPLSLTSNRSFSGKMGAAASIALNANLSAVVGLSTDQERNVAGKNKFPDDLAG